MINYPAWVTPTTSTFCTATGCRKPHPKETSALAEADEATPVPRRAVRGTGLCEWHHRQFGRVLGDLVGLWTDLEAARVRRSAPRTNDRVSSSAVSDAGVLWNPHVARVLYELADWTGFLVRTILREEPLPAPVVREWPRTRVWQDAIGERHSESYLQVQTLDHTHGLTLDDPPRVALAGIASWHARWLSEYPALGAALLQDALNHRRVALAALDTPPVRRLLVRGYSCQEPVEVLDFGGTLICDAPLFAIIRDETDRTPTAILCSANPAHPQLPKDRWMEYAHGR